jgi:hypothetical protein
MSVYMFHLELPELTNEIVAKIPMHREHVNKLFMEKRLLSYSVSQTRKFIWCALVAEDEQEALEIASQFPLYPFFTDIMCHPLLFHNTQPSSLPDISLN